MKIAFYGSSLLSAYWNGAATYYRGVIRALAERGHELHFFEPRAFQRQENADIAPPDWCRSTVYEPDEAGLNSVLSEARRFDVVIKTSGVGVLDDELLTGLQRAREPHALFAFWDVDAPATQAELAAAPDMPLRRLLPHIDMVMTYGGGPPVVERYKELGARACHPIYNAVDPDTHHPVLRDERFAGDLAFLGNRLPDRETRVDEYFFRAAERARGQRFLIGGSGWDDKAAPDNVRKLGHVPTRDHNAFNCTPRAVLNVAREAMAQVGYSPATRVFEAAGAAACLISDIWDGVGQFLEPGEEILLARDGADVAEILAGLDGETAARIGAAARRRVLDQHTYASRAAQAETLFQTALARKRETLETA